jgi:hypothetical protein
MSLQNLISRFNDGDGDFLSSFGSESEEEWDRIKRFLKLVESRKLTHLINLDTPIDFYESHTQNLFDRYCFNNPDLQEKFINHICRQFYKNISCVDGKIYLELRSMDELADLFCGEYRSNDISSYELAKGILGEDFYEPYSDTTEDVYEDVIEQLSEINFKMVCNRASDELNEINFEDYSDDIYNTIIPYLAEDQGSDSVLKLNQNMFELMFKDETTFNFLIDEVFDDTFKYSLMNCHGNAYNSALVDDWYKEVFYKLESFGINKGEWIKGNSVKTYNKYRIDITTNFKELLGSFLDALQGYRENLYDYNSYFSLVSTVQQYSDDFDCLTLRLSDYPDYKKVKENINESIFDYVEF